MKQTINLRLEAALAALDDMRDNASTLIVDDDEIDIRKHIRAAISDRDRLLKALSSKNNT